MFVGLLGVAYFADIHHIAYFIVVQIFVGAFEVSPHSHYHDTIGSLCLSYHAPFPPPSLSLSLSLSGLLMYMYSFTRECAFAFCIHSHTISLQVGQVW